MNKKLITNNLIALGICLVAVLAFCAPAFSGKVLKSHDNLSWQYMSKTVRDYHKEHGGSIYWTNSMFGGMPSVTFGGGDSGNLIADTMFGFTMALPRPLGMFLLAMFGFFVMTLGFRMHWLLRALVTLACLFTSYNPIIAYVGHDTKFLAIGFAAGLFGSMLITIRRNLYLGLLLTTIFSALFITSGHYQIVYYFLLCLPFMVGVLLYQAKQNGTLPQTLKAFVLMLVVGIIGVIPPLKSVIGTRDYTKYTMRGGSGDLVVKDSTSTKSTKRSGLDIEYAYRWSNGIGETFTTLIAGLYGPMSPQVYAEGKTAEKCSELGLSPQLANNLPTYWGPQPFLSGAVYFGALIMFLSVFAILTANSKHKWWILAACAVCIMLSWGKNFSFNNILFNLLPGYNKFRTPSMALSLPQFLFPLLAGLGLQEIISGTQDAKQLTRKLLITLGITSLLVLALGFGGFTNVMGDNDKQAKSQMAQAFGQKSETVISELYSAIKQDRASHIQSDAIHSLLFILIGAGLVWLLINKKISTVLALAGLLIASTADLWIQNSKISPNEQYYEDKDAFEANFLPRPVDEQIKKDPNLFYRVHDLTTDPFNDARPSMFHNLIGGYSPAKMQTYQDMIEYHLSKNNVEVLNMLNCRYIIFGQEKPTVMPRINEACGNAWFVPQVKTVPDAFAEITSLNAPSLSDSTAKGDFVARKVAIVREDQLKKVGGSITANATDTSAKIALTKYSLNELEYTCSNNSSAGFAVFSDIYYEDGCKAYIDGKETPIIRTNYILRGLNIPANAKQIKFVILPPHMNTLHKVSLAGSILLFATCGLLAYLWNKNKTDALVGDAV